MREKSCGAAVTILVAIAVLSSFASSQETKRTPSAFNAEAARGTITQIVSLDDASQSYALYLPSRYSAERRWPIIYGFDPFGRGDVAVEVYRAAAEKYGYIVAGSNNSKNGPSALQLEAAQAMWNDTHRRLAIDKERVYSTGLSGGARAATAIALYCETCNITGVIAQGATYPANQSTGQSRNDHFLYYVAIGDLDFNYPEVVALRKKKEEVGAPYKIKAYSGTHGWAPAAIVEDAVAWLELKAMQVGTEKVDNALVQRLFDATRAEGVQANQRGDTMSQFYALHSLVVDFKGLEEVKEFERQLADLKASKAWRAALREEQRDIDEQAALTASAAGELQELASESESQADETRKEIASTLSDLRRRSKSSGRDHVVGSRAFLQLWIQGIEAGQDEFRNKLFSQAAMYFELMADASPEQAWPLVLLAEAQTRAGDKKAAIKALEEAEKRGLKDPHALAQDSELEGLHSDPAFRRIVQGAGAK